MFFITSSTDRKRNLLQSDRPAELFVSVLYDYRAQGKYRVHEFVVMPDHFHIMLTVGSELSIEKAVQFIKGGFAFRSGKELGFSAPVWQEGFSEVRVLDEEAYGKIVAYIRNNPVMRGFVTVASEFRYSSAYTGFELDSAPQGLKAPSSAGMRSARLKPCPDTNLVTLRVSRAQQQGAGVKPIEYRTWSA